MKVKCRGYEGELIKLEQTYELKGVNEIIKRFYSISIKVDMDTTVDIDNVTGNEILIEEKG